MAHQTRKAFLIGFARNRGIELQMDRLVDKKVTDGKVFYKVQWKRVAIAYSTWEPIDNITNQELIDKYESAQPEAIRARIEGLLNKRLGEKGIEYLVRWLSGDTTWMTRQELLKIDRKLVLDFEAELREQSGTAARVRCPL